MTAATDLIMENYLKSPYTKRYIIEDSIPKVTSDGQPHEMITLVAGLAGMFAAVVILGILVSLIGCKHKERQSNPNEAPPSPGVSEIPELKGKRSSTLPLFSKSISMEETSPRLVSVSVISNNFPYVPNEIALGPKSDKNVISFGNLQRY